METQKKILIIEDETPILNILVDSISKAGYISLSAKDGDEGLKVALENHPDLILLDILMPKMDGMDMMKKLRQESEWGKSVPIIILTNYSATDERIIRGIAEDTPAYYLVKSDWKIDDILKKMEEIFNEQEG